MRKKKAILVNDEEIKFCVSKSGNVFILDSANNSYKSIGSEDDSHLDADLIIEGLRAIETLHSPGGYYYNTTKLLLDFYHNLKSITRANENIRKDLDSDLQIVIKPYGKIMIDPSDGEDMFDLAKDIFMTCSLTSNKRRSAVSCMAKNWDNASLTSTYINIIESSVQSMVDDEDKKTRRYGQILEIKYIETKYINCSHEECARISGESAGNYNKLLREAIQSLSMRIFGILPGDHGPFSLMASD